MTDNKKKWYVVTEEGVEGSGYESPLDALIEYIELSDVNGDRINKILEGRSEINYVAQYSKKQLNEMPEV